MPLETDNSTFSKLSPQFRQTTSNNLILQPLDYSDETCELEIEAKKKKKNWIFRLLGLKNSPSQHNSTHYRHFIDFFSSNSDRTKNQNRATGDSHNGQSLIFEPSIMVCVPFVCVCLCVRIWFMWWWFREINWFHLRLLARIIHSLYRSFTQFCSPRNSIQLLHISIYYLQKYNDCKFIPHLIPPNPAIRALLVFHKDDPISEAMARSCERLSIEASRAKTTEVALEIFQSPANGGHHLVIVDGRCKNIDFESFGRWVGLAWEWKLIQWLPPHEQIVAKLQRQSVHDNGGGG